MHKKIKIFIIFFFLFILTGFFQTTSAKYVIEQLYTIANINIDRCKPNIELVDITSSNPDYPTYANQTHLITGHLKVIEKNTIKNNLSMDTIKVAICHSSSFSNHDIISITFKNFSLISETATEKIYEFSFTNTLGDGTLAIIIPEGIIEDKSRFSQ